MRSLGIAGVERQEHTALHGGTVPVQRRFIHGGLTIEAQDGLRHTLRSAGLQANRLEHLLAACASEEVSIEALRHLGMVMRLRCEAGSGHQGRLRAPGRAPKPG